MMEWPETDPRTGKPATTQTAKDIWSDFCCGNDTLRQTIADCQNWRRDYMTVVQQLVAYQCQAPPEEALRMAQAGLDSMHSKFIMREIDAKKTMTTNLTIPARQAFLPSALSQFSGFDTQTIQGTVPAPSNYYSFPLASPHGTDHTPIFIQGQDAVAQLETWKSYGCLEDSAAHHAATICTMKNISLLVKDKVFVLLGATSAMGPAKSLLAIPGARVLGIARAGTNMKELKAWCSVHGSADATLQTPGDGADMLLHGPAIAQWIIETAPANQEIILCHLAYMDGEAHVRITVAMDMITQYVTSQYNGKVTLGFLSSPATVHSIPAEAVHEAKTRYNSKPTWESIAGIVSLGKWLQPTHVWDNGGLLNGLAHLQGPNYALAKTAQQWRCMVAYWNDGQTVSAPHAPPTRTDSMVRYNTIATVLEGMQSFEPMISFDVLPTSSLMTAILLYQITEETSVCRPINKAALTHPLQVMWDGSVHGGSWRCPYTTESAGTLAFLLGKTMSAPYKPLKSLAARPMNEQNETV